MSRHRPSERDTSRGPCMEVTELTKATRFLSNMRFRVDLPEVVCDMKALVTPFDATEVAKFGLTHEEKQPPEVVLPSLLGFGFGSRDAHDYGYDVRPPSPDAVELTDPESLESLPSLDEQDYAILDTVEGLTQEWMMDKDSMTVVPRKRKQLPAALRHIASDRWWIEERQEAERKLQEIRPVRLPLRSKRKRIRRFASKEAYIASINRGFEKARRVPNVRMSNVLQSTSQRPPSAVRKAVAVYDLEPYVDQHGRSFCTVNFHNNCVDDSDRLMPHGHKYSAQIAENVLLKELYVEPKTQQEAEVNKALDFDNKYLGLMAPCYVRSNSDRREATVEDEGEYLWIREYFYRKRKGSAETGKWKWALRLDRERKKAQLVPIEMRLITQKQKLRSVIPRPISVRVTNKAVEEQRTDIDVFD